MPEVLIYPFTGKSLTTQNYSSSHRMNTIAVIIPSYNEGKRIQQVLDVLCQVEEISEILVVDDGSTDRTIEQVIKSQNCDQRIRLLLHRKNLGKGQAVYTGLQSTAAEVIVTLDADLENLMPDQVRELFHPVLIRSVDMNVAVFRGGKFYTDFSHWATPWLSGQRCLSRGRLMGINWRAAAGYGLETAITVASQKQHWRCQRIIWKGVSHPPSEGHRGLFHGIWNRAKMYGQILRAWWIASVGDIKPTFSQTNVH